MKGKFAVSRNCGETIMKGEINKIQMCIHGQADIAGKHSRERWEIRIEALNSNTGNEDGFAFLFHPSIIRRVRKQKMKGNNRRGDLDLLTKF
jgi:hypothetical protein